MENAIGSGGVFNLEELGSEWCYELSKMYMDNGISRIRDVKGGYYFVLIRKSLFESSVRRPGLGDFGIYWGMKHYSELASSGWNVLFPNNGQCIDDPGTMREKYQRRNVVAGANEKPRLRRVRNKGLLAKELNVFVKVNNGEVSRKEILFRLGGCLVSRINLCFLLRGRG